MDLSVAAIVSLLIFTGAVILSALLVAWENGWNFVQPHALHAAWLVVIMGFIPLLQRAYGIMDCPEGAAKTAGVLLLHLAFFTLPFLWLPGGLRRMSVCRVFWLNPPVFSRVQHVFLVVAGLLVMAGAYVAVALLDGFGLMNWLFFPRIGFQYFHPGAGVWYVLTMAALVFLFLWISFYILPRRRGWVVALWAIVVAAVFMVVFSAYDLSFKRFRQRQEMMVLLGTCGDGASIPLSSRYGGSMPGGNIVEKILQYSTHYDDTRTFVGEFDQRFHLLYGREYISGFWKYIPRPLVPQKPKVYGRLQYIVEAMYPGSVESGHMPDVGGPPFRNGVEAYLNFGLAGVCLMALLKGIVSVIFLERMRLNPDFPGYAGLSVCMGYPFLPSVEGVSGTVFWYLLILAALWSFYRVTRKRIGAEKEIGISSF